MERLKLLNEPNELFVVNIGPNTFSTYPVDVTIESDTDLLSVTDTVVRELTAQQVLLDYSI